MPAHLLSSGRRSSQPPSSIPARSGRIRGCDIASPLESRTCRFSPAPPQELRRYPRQLGSGRCTTPVDRSSADLLSQLRFLLLPPLTSGSKNYNSQKALPRPSRSRHAPFYPIQGRALSADCRPWRRACGRAPGMKRPPTLVSGIPLCSCHLFIFGTGLGPRSKLGNNAGLILSMVNPTLAYTGLTLGGG